MKFNLKTWLLQFIAGGDLVLLNANFMRNGKIRPKELGNVVIDNCDFVITAKDYVLSFGNKDDIQIATLDFETIPGTQVAYVRNCSIDMRRTFHNSFISLDDRLANYDRKREAFNKTKLGMSNAI